MRCPKCKERVTHFGTWAFGLNALRKVFCPKCGARLRASQRTEWVQVCVLVMTMPLALALMTAPNMWGVSVTTWRLIFGVVVLMTIGLEYWEWKTGFYVLREDWEPD